MTTRRFVALPAALAAALGAGGCKSDAPATDADAAARPVAAVPAPPVEGLSPESNSARAAAMIVATMPPVTAAARREIRLHAALYRETLAGNVGDVTEHFLLEPFGDDATARLALPTRELRLRILAELSDLRVPVAWTVADPAPDPPPTFFPGTRELATRLRVRIVERTPDEVRAEVSDLTGHVGGSRQQVVATWADDGWEVRREGPRLVW
ncbi:MAG: hypothetical protein ACYTG1_08530 [Planctomycetota bacterium]